MGLGEFFFGSDGEDMRTKEQKALNKQVGKAGDAVFGAMEPGAEREVRQLTQDELDATQGVRDMVGANQSGNIVQDALSQMQGFTAGGPKNINMQEVWDQAKGGLDASSAYRAAAIDPTLKMMQERYRAANNQLVNSMQSRMSGNKNDARLGMYQAQLATGNQDAQSKFLGNFLTDQFNQFSGQGLDAAKANLGAGNDFVANLMKQVQTAGAGDDQMLKKLQALMAAGGIQRTRDDDENAAHFQKVDPQQIAQIMASLQKGIAPKDIQGATSGVAGSLAGAALGNEALMTAAPALLAMI